jgi:Uma2 family endonuclease
MTPEMEAIMSTATDEKLLTIEEFANRPNPPGYPEELVRGRIVCMNVPKPYHGYVCNRVGRLLGNHAEANGLGYVMNNDSGVITERGPDTLRGADVAFYSFARVPKGTLPRKRYLDVVPELIFEVLSPDDRWSEVLEKVAEYLKAGVTVVGVLDPGQTTLHLFRDCEPTRILNPDDEFTLPEILGDFRVRVRDFFD